MRLPLDSRSGYVYNYKMQMVCIFVIMCFRKR